MPLTTRPRPQRPARPDFARRSIGARARLTVLIAALALLIVPAADAAAETSVFGWGTPQQVGVTPEHAGDTTPVIPTTIPEAAGATAAAIGTSGSFVVTPSGVLAAGSGINLGLGKLVTSAIPFTPIPDTAGATAVAAAGLANSNEYGLILKGGTVLGFGSNKSGANGVAIGAGTSTSTPTAIAGLSDVTAIAAGQVIALALESDGNVWEWGELSLAGQGTNTFTPQQVALPTGPGLKPTAIAAGAGHGLALMENGSVYAWGRNAKGQVGNGGTTVVGTPFEAIPPPAPDAPRVVSISAGKEASFAVYSDGTYRAWGENTKGQLGLGSGSAAAVTVPTAPDPAALAAHPDRYPPLARISPLNSTTYAIVGGAGANAGQVLAWGENSKGQLGFGAAAPSYDFAFPYVPATPNTVGTSTQGATEIPQRLGRLKGVTWLGVGVNGGTEIAPSEQTIRFLSVLSAFFSHPIGTISAPQAEQLESRGSQSTITSVKITGPDQEDFDVVAYGAYGSGEQLPIGLASEHATNIWVRFHPSALGDRLATLQVQANGETATVQLTGYGAELPGNTPGPQGDRGEPGSPGPAGPAGPAGSDGVVVFTSTRAKVSARRGTTASLGFLLVNGTTARLAGTTVVASVPKALGASASAGETTRVAPLAAGGSRQVKLPLKIGRRAQLGTHAVKVAFRAGARTVTRTIRVRVTR